MLFLVACGGKKLAVTIEVNANLTLKVDQEMKLAINHVADDLTFEGEGDVVSIRTSGEDVFIKGLKTGEVTLKVSYKPNPKITADINVKVTPKPVQQGYQLNFSVTAPEGFEGDVYAVGEFNKWNIANPLKLTLANGKYTGSSTYTTSNVAMAYKYFSLDDFEYGESDVEGNYVENRSLTLADYEDILNDEIVGFEKLPVYMGTFSVSIYQRPSSTGNHPVKLIGSMTNWSSDEALVFTDLGTKLRVSFEIDYNQTHFFKIYLDKGQENWADHEKANDINTPADNYIITPFNHLTV